MPFDSIEEANQNTLLNALIWSSISEDKEYERDEVGAMYLPTADIDAAAAELYGYQRRDCQHLLQRERKSGYNPGEYREQDQ